MEAAMVALLLLTLKVLSSASVNSDGALLLAAKNQWNANLPSWTGDDPCRNWKGVLCDDNNRVSHLNLSNEGIIGPIPNQIGQLEYLTNLDLSNQRDSDGRPWNSISGDLSALQGLTNLQSLNLTLNNLTIQFPLELLLTFTNLTDLRLDNNNLSGQLPKELSQLTKLQYLYLGNNTSMTGPLPLEFGSLVNLLELSLWDINMKSEIPAQLGNLSNLIYLNLHSCDLFGGLPPEFGSLTSVQILTLNRNYLTGSIPNTWRSMTKLRDLHLQDNYLTKYFPPWMQDLPSLVNLNLSRNYLYGYVQLLSNSPLENLNIACNFFSGSKPKPPTNMNFTDTGNCFSGYIDINAKINCEQRPYYNCDEFLNSVPNGSCPVCPLPQTSANESTCVCDLQEKRSSQNWKLIGSLVGVALFLILGFFGWLIWMRRKRVVSRHERYFQVKEHHEFWKAPKGVERFTFQDLAKATENFNNNHEIGIGGFGKVFYGTLDSGKRVAIKCASASGMQSSLMFHNEVLLLSRLHHRNLVRLEGFCEDDGIQILVYEYMPNGNLHTQLFNNDAAHLLDWFRRLEIAAGIAQGLDYLHSFADPPVIHRDVKPSNILLDENLVAKIADFGLSKATPEFESHFSTRPAGTAGYIDPQYVLRQQLTTASDVYGFGVVLLELISGQKAIDNTRLVEHNLVEWVKLKLNNEGFRSVVDPRLGSGYPEHVYQDVIRLAIDCASFNSDDRPSMKAVVTILDACLWAVCQHPLEIAHQPDERVHDQISAEEVIPVQSSAAGIGSISTYDAASSVSIILPR